MTYYILSITVIQINDIIPFINNSLPDDKRNIISLISVIATISTGLITFTKCNEGLIRDRNTYESIKYEVEIYTNKVANIKINKC